MLVLTFSEDERQALEYERFHHPHPRVQRRMEALWLKSQGLPHRQIAQLCGISENTLRSNFRLWQDGGLDRLKEFHFHTPESELDQHWNVLEDDLLEHPPATIAEAAHRIEQQTGIRRSPTQVRAFLKRMGLRRLKVGCLPAKADPAQQEDFKKSSSSLG